MEAVFLKVLNMSFAAGWLILVVAALRRWLKRAPKWLLCLLWVLVGLRLVCPFSIESALSLIPSAETFNAYNIQYETPQINSGITIVNRAVNPILAKSFEPDPFSSINPFHALTAIAGCLWLLGIAVLLVYALISYLRVYRSVAEAVPLRDNIWLCDTVRSPFILGLFRPRIFLPSGLDAGAAEPVIAHERAHLQRRDHWWKPLGFLILTVHWFNPLCWLAYALLCRDIELACDEKVVRAMDLEEKKAYSAALLECSVRQRLVTVCPLAFGEVGVKERVKSVLRYRKPAFWIVTAAAAACVAAGVCFATDPLTPPGLEQVSSVSVLTVDSEAFQTVSDESAEELLELLSAYRCTPRSVELDYAHTRSSSLIGTAAIETAGGASYQLRYLRHAYDFGAVRMDCKNGDMYLLVLDYYKGLHTPLGHLITGTPGARCGFTGEDDYECVLISFPKGGGPKKAWQMECSFDHSFSKWFFSQVARTGSTPDGDPVLTVVPTIPSLPSALRYAASGTQIFPLRDEDGSGWCRIRLGDVPALMDPNDPLMAIESYALVDLDGDGVTEAVFRVCGTSGDTSGYVVLHAHDGTAQGFRFGWRSFWELKADGTFSHSWPQGAEESVVSLRFKDGDCQIVRHLTATGEAYDFHTFTAEGRAVSEETYRAALAAQAEKPDAQWYAYVPTGQDGAQAAPVQNLDFTAWCVRTNGYIKGEQYPKTLWISSADELADYYERYKDQYDFGSASEPAPAGTELRFIDLMPGYDERFFETHDLILVVLEEPSGSIRHTVTAVTAGPSPLDHVQYRVQPVITYQISDPRTSDMAEWHILIQIDKAYGRLHSDLQPPYFQ